jgi:hypothetical protein
VTFKKKKKKFESIDNEVSLLKTIDLKNIKIYLYFDDLFYNFGAEA